MLQSDNPTSPKACEMPRPLFALVLAALLALSPGAPGLWAFGVGVAFADDDGDDGGDDDGDDDNSPGRSPGDRGDRGGRGDRRAAPPLAQRQPASPARIDTAPAFAPAEVVALGLGPGDVAVLLALGYRVLDDRTLASMGGLRALRLAVPQGRSLEVARNELRRVAPGAAADFNHFYRSEQGPAPACNGPACGPRSQIGWPFPPAGALPGCDPGGMIGMIDTGVDATHTALQGRAEVVRLDPGRLRASGDLHGTGVAALLVGTPGSQTPGLLPATRLLAVDAFHTDGADERAGVFDLLAGLDLLFLRGVRVVNLSLAGPPNAVLERMVERLYRQGVLMVAAVGNGGAQSGPAWPAAYPQVLAVTAVDARGGIYRRAVQGPHVELAAPGVQVWTAAPQTGGRARNGTSFAAPFVTAAVHVLMSRGLDAGQIRATLAATATDLGPPGPDPVFGHGLLQAGGLCAVSAG